MTASAIDKSIQAHVTAASRIAEEHVEKLARKILKRHRRLLTFCLGMGTAAFYDKHGPIGHSDPRTKELDDFLCEWDSTLRLTGIPMKIEGHDGVKKTDW